MSGTLERRLPFALGVLGPIAFLICWRGADWSPTGTNLRSVFGAVTGFGGAIVGFLITAKSLLLTLPESRASRFLGGSGLRILAGYLMADIWVWLCVTALSIALSFAAPADDATAGTTLNGLLALWCYLVAVGGFTLHRSASLVSELVRQSFRDE